MLFSNAHVKRSVRKPLFENVHAGSTAHRRMDADHALVLFGLSRQSLGKVICVRLGLAALFELFSCWRVLFFQFMYKRDRTNTDRLRGEWKLKKEN